MTAVRRLPDGRIAHLVPAEDAGQFRLEVVDGVIGQMRAAELLTWRQAEALHELGRLRRLSGWLMAWERPAGRGERDARTEEAAGQEFAALLDLVAEPARGWVLHIVSTGEWPIAARVSRVQDAADVVADRLKLARDNA